ncbi:unnamed protein product [Trifolium pratense]|uniref:Uncharacterized protein n=1 Tax=Trifolium pratense TaxID=57577 RepID=A0ACB0KBS0_TRIPR|nr:unnamed protein product [Trifolium pratense]
MTGQKESENSDRLSDLPDHLLLHIIQFMITKHAIQTCILSKRWKDLWKSLTNLTLHHSRDGFHISNKFVSHILSDRDHSLPLHKLIYYYYHLISEDILHPDPAVSPETTLLEVMKYAASHNVQQLKIDVGQGLIKDLELPPSIFHCHSLTFLMLNFQHPDSHDYSKIIFPKSLNLPALKTLYLSFVTFTTSENGCAEPFSTCNMLSTLHIICCSLQDDAKTLCISNSNVSSLVVGDPCMHTRGFYKDVVFCTPKLTFLTIMGFLGCVSPSVSNLPFLEKANFDYGYRYNPFKESLLIDWLHLLANVKLMNISFRTLREIQHGIIPCFVRLKSLEIQMSCDEPLIFHEMIRGEVRKKATCILQKCLHAKVDIILKSGSTSSKLEDDEV